MMSSSVSVPYTGNALISLLQLMNRQEVGMDQPTQSASLMNDRPADRDLLDFAPYTNTLLDIIRDPHTEGPLVIGLFGTWGSGKTSLMKFVQDDLARDAQVPSRLVRRVEVREGRGALARAAAAGAG